jgi:septum formation protein
MPRIVLASTSPYRRELLARLRLPFTVVAPDVDETPQPGEAPVETARRLALTKARAVAAREPGAVVIGSDQVADLEGCALSKPGSHEAALAQLRALRGRSVVFHTAVALVQDGRAEVAEVPTSVRFHTLDDAALERYLRADTPYDCAGAARVESLGIVLLEQVRADDPTALVGLPLIRVTQLLGRFGVDVLAA